jgi:hypothetical protein
MTVTPATCLFVILPILSGHVAKVHFKARSHGKYRHALWELVAGKKSQDVDAPAGR